MIGKSLGLCPQFQKALNKCCDSLEGMAGRCRPFHGCRISTSCGNAKASRPNH